jgi:bifunctional DNA-binding transcriptional regulator/antitoxin component of YhaV-PrlF toxin-antitoxin module
MIYKTILTSKGTTTIPKAIRDQLGVKPGMLISFTKNQSTGEYVLKRAQTITELREVNKLALEKAGTSHKQYENGAGYSAHIAQKLGAR